MSSSGGVSGGGGAPVGANYFVGAAHADLSAETVFPGWLASPDIQGAGGTNIALEFQSGDAAPTWSPSAPDTVSVGVTVLSHLYVLSTDGTERLGLYAWAPAGDFTAIMKLTNGSNQNATGFAPGFFITDDDNSERILMIASQPNGGFAANLQAYTYTAATYTQRGSNWACQSNTIYFRMTRVGGTINFDFSYDGVIWQRIAAQAFAITVAFIGVRISNGGAVTTEVAFDYIRATG